MGDKLQELVGSRYRDFLSTNEIINTIKSKTLSILKELSETNKVHIL